MNSNDFRISKLNKWEKYIKNNIFVQFVEKHIYTNLKNFIKRYSNYTHTICQKAMEYESISYSSYQKR